jgi:AraC family transcriptional regulator
VEGFHLSEWEYPQTSTAPRHTHEFAYFNMVVQGGHIEALSREELTLERGALVYHPPGEVHWGEIACKGTRIYGIEIAPGRLERLKDAGLLLQERRTLAGAIPVWLATRIYQEFVRMDPVSPLAIEGLALELLAELGRHSSLTQTSIPPRWLLQARDLLHARFTESLSLDEIARAVGVHPDHLVHTFRRQYHCSVGDYVRQLRVDFACRCMASSDAPLAEIALEAGFTDQSHFTRTFRRHMGITPAQFQREARSSRSHTIR